MAVLQIQQYDLKSISQLLDSKLPGEVNGVVVGREVKDRNKIQVTSLLDSVSEDSLKKIEASLGHTTNSFKVALTLPAPNPTGPSTARVVEYVASTFPASQVTPDFRKKIEEDFLKFESIFKGASFDGHQGWVAGWTSEDHESASIEGGKARSFVVSRGWDSMAEFEACLISQRFKEASPILFGWGAPYEMWHVERVEGQL